MCSQAIFRQNKGGIHPIINYTRENNLQWKDFPLNWSSYPKISESFVHSNAAVQLCSQKGEICSVMESEKSEWKLGTKEVIKIAKVMTDWKLWLSDNEGSKDLCEKHFFWPGQRQGRRERYLPFPSQSQEVRSRFWHFHKQIATNKQSALWSLICYPELLLAESRRFAKHFKMET